MLKKELKYNKIKKEKFNVNQISDQINYNY